MERLTQTEKGAKLFSSPSPRWGRGGLLCLVATCRLRRKAIRQSGKCFERTVFLCLERPLQDGVLGTMRRGEINKGLKGLTV